MVRRKFVGKFRRNTDDCTVNRNVVGSSSVYSDEFPTTTTVTFFIGMSSKSRRKIPTTHVSSEFHRKWPTEFRRVQIFGFRRKLVGNPSQTSDDIDVRRNLRRNLACFLVVFGCWSKAIEYISRTSGRPSENIDHVISGYQRSGVSQSGPLSREGVVVPVSAGNSKTGFELPAKSISDKKNGSYTTCAMRPKVSHCPRIATRLVTGGE
ncbi:hypothetical protein F2Q69_00049848 [Brassica cretica]|uniref:Uncharacterized protein n=1 Tax=Brassica cretica TaxID=69181 RepID=A0A8S9PWH0_BRACR|nr:hypothetical protein F2Q69_00049848 [Brassica cretica]